MEYIANTLLWKTYVKYCSFHTKLRKICLKVILNINKNNCNKVFSIKIKITTYFKINVKDFKYTIKICSMAYLFVK